MMDHSLTVPVSPGHAAAEDILAVLLNPATKVEWLNYSLVAGVSYLLPAMSNRMEVVVQLQDVGTVWVNIGGEVAVVGQGFKCEGLMSFKLATSIPVALISAANVALCIIQFGVR